MTKLVLPFLLVICASIATAGTRQDPKSTRVTISTGELTLSAEQVISDSRAGTIQARGNVEVEIRQRRFTVHADEVEITTTNEMFSLVSRGNVQMTVPTDDGSTRTINTNGSHMQVRRIN